MNAENNEHDKTEKMREIKQAEHDKHNASDDHEDEIVLKETVNMTKNAKL